MNAIIPIFLNKILNGVDKSSENKILSSKKIKIEPWITKGLLNSIRKRDNLFTKYKSNPNNLLLKNNYLAYRNRLRKLLYDSKVQYYKTLLENETNNKKQWETMNELTGNHNKTNNTIKSIKTENNLILNKKQDIANYINSYFSNISPQIAKTCKNINLDNNVKQSFTNKVIPDSLNFSNVQKLR